jgi:hypothetical protein
MGHVIHHNMILAQSQVIDYNHCKEEYSLTPFTIQNNFKINMNKNISNVDIK